MIHFFFFSSRRRHTRSLCDWSSDVCSSDLRAVLVVGMGGEPEGLTEGLQGLVRRYAPALPPPDVVRMLTVLSETEVPLRASGNMRLAVEVLLLRWAMMSRTVELEEVIRAL